MDNETGVY